MVNKPDWSYFQC